MSKKNKIGKVQGTLRAGLCLFMLSGTCVLPAQAQAPDAPDNAATSTAAPRSASSSSKYEMKEISGTIYDAATKQPMAGVRVQALDNRLYTAMTDENGKYTVRVPEFVTALYISCPDYNGVQLPIKGASGQDAQLYTDKLKAFYQDGTSLSMNKKAEIDNSSALTIEDEFGNLLTSSVRTITRGGLPAQGASMFINGLNSLNSIAQPLVVVDGVEWDMQYDRSALHDGYYNNVFNLIDVEDIESVRSAVRAWLRASMCVCSAVTK